MTAKTMSEVLHGMKVPWGGRSDGLIWLDANASHAIEAALSAAGFGLVADAGAKALEDAAWPQPKRRRRRGASRVLPPVEDQEPYVYPPDPYWGTDERGRFRYVDYDGESLHVWRDKDGELWIDKRGEGPVYVRAQDIPVIAAAVRGES